MESKNITKMLLMRLPTYLNYLKSLPESREHISSTKIAQALGLGDVLVRKDLAKVSDSGRCKIGYNCKELINDIEKFMNRVNMVDAVIVGVGKLGQLLLDYDGFETFGLNVLAGFDGHEYKKTDSGKCIYPLERLDQFCKENSVQIGIITGSTECAQSLCNSLLANGIKVIWNFVPVHLDVPDDVIIQNENISVSLMILLMKLKNLD